MSTIAKKDSKDPQSADWGHLIKLLKILLILFISFSSFHWFMIKRAQTISTGSSFSQSILQKFSPGAKIYTVKEGDTLWKIAYRQYPQRNPQEIVNEIKKINQMNTDSIKAGQPIKLP